MRCFSFIIFLWIYILSCNEQNTKRNTVRVFAGSTQGSEIHTVDSLDLDTSLSFITTNFPDSVHKVLYGSNTLLWSYVDSSMRLVENIRKDFSATMLVELLLESNFSIDTGKTVTTATKREFNKRYEINWLTENVGIIMSKVQYWYRGKKYILINIKWKDNNGRFE